MTRITVKQNKQKNCLTTTVSFARLCFVFLIFVSTRKSNKNSSSRGTSQNKQNTDLFKLFLNSNLYIFYIYTILDTTHRQVDR